MTASPLPLLIRCARLQVDERRVELAAMAQQEEAAEAALRRHEAEASAEQELAAADPALRAGFAAWARHAARQRVRLLDRHAKLRRTRDSAADALLDSCAELKRLELAEDARQAALRRAAARRTEAKAEELDLIRRAAAG